MTPDPASEPVEKEAVEELPLEGAPELPTGYRLRLPGRGTTFVRAAQGPPGAPTVVLLHGWIATGALNWFQAFEPLSEHFSVLAPDLRGHGHGIRSARRFTLADCADDVAALLRRQRRGPVIVVGYSMGGSVAQLMWRRHRDLVSGVVLAATGCEFVRGGRERYLYSAFMNTLAATTRVSGVVSWLPGIVVRRAMGIKLGASATDGGPLASWARHEMAGHNVRMILEAAQALTTYDSKEWLGDIDVPTSVLITEHDTTISPTAQFRMAMTVPDAHINRIDHGHTALTEPVFGRKITDACLDVQRRVDLASGPHITAVA
jgi:3-oxoadipate enol-lactonase